MERDMSLVVSTGMLSVKEVQEMLRPGFGSRACPEVAVLHCVRKYPTPKWEANLPRIAELRQAMEEIGFRPALVGYSDHTQGLESAVDAVEHYGACWIEKHFTLDRKMVGPDHWFSADPEEMGKLVRCLN
jgi:N-acetylneuraminate synthase/N,N'-diacetyllegionaminate synthase